jgi:glucose/arabinose dehydrogenase
MYLPLKPELLAAAILLIADGVPTFDVEPFCRRVAAMARPVGDVEVCLQKEREARDQLMQQWTQFPVGDRSYSRELTTGFDPTYTELLTCLELQRDARMLRERDSETTEPSPGSKAKPAPRHMVTSGSVGVSQNRIVLLRDADRDGVAETRSVFLDNLNQPFGMTLVGDTLFVANTDGVMRFPYKEGDRRIEAPGDLILSLPAGGYNNHWTRNVVAKPDGRKLYVSVGSASNVGEYGMDEEVRRANILEINLDGSGEKVFAAGLRNPNGMAWQPATGALWTAVNERDGLGDDLVPDYITSVREDGFYGWPYSYFGKNEDPRLKGKRPELVARAIVPDYAVGSHTASLGLVFYSGRAFPEHYRGGAFVGQRGSWNRLRFAGYKVLFVPFRDGEPAGPPEDFLTGFMANPQTGEAHGRPVGLGVLEDGSLLVTDDAGNMVWRVQAAR